jgi:hypothetical protein
MALNINTYTEKFFILEEKLKLFDDCENGILWWDVVRHDVYYYVYNSFFSSQTCNAYKPSIFLRLKNFTVTRLKRVKLLIATSIYRYDVIGFRAARQSRNGKSFDPAMDGILSFCGGEHLIIDTFPCYYHHDLRLYVDGSLGVPKILEKLAAELHKEVGSALLFDDIVSFVMPRINRFLRAKKAYIKLFRRVSPRLIVMSQNGIQKAMFSAANELGIPLLEMQHGLINYVHPAYSYSRKIDYNSLSTFPNYFLCFSPYWVNNCYLPLARCESVGNDEFYVESIEMRAEVGSVLFISADVYQNILNNWVVALALRLPNRRVLYKLHPNQMHELDDIRRELASYPNIVVIGGEVQVHDLLLEASVVALVQSTVAYEALQMGRQLCVIPVMDFQTHQDLFDLPTVHITATIDDLIYVVESPSNVQNPPVFFDRFDQSRVKVLLDGIYRPACEPSQLSVDDDSYRETDISA